ncbi:TIM barrel protein [Novosphingobium sp. BL-8H]|uniref:sugar phosphate isomerase/epimerase family protein n=1 Tax=Novosphingobium sp. BL-8H TaxID=3127640 RepID=UPI0037568788
MTNRLALDHITTVDATPAQLARAASAAGCGGICLFMEPMAVLPVMPQFDIIGDTRARADFKRVLSDCGVVLDLAYPFTLAGRTDPLGFEQALECAAELEAGFINVLAYDREPARRTDVFGRFCERASAHGLRVAVEFYPPSQVRSLAEALDLVRAVGRPGQVGINVDLLHLMRSGGTLEELAATPGEYILYGQLCDGPATAPDDLDAEASSARRLGGEGDFDLAGFVRALPVGTPLSVEIPRNHALAEPREARAMRAVESVRSALSR